jgi:hypothetical protein
MEIENLIKQKVMLGVKGVVKYFSLSWSQLIVKELSKCSLFGFNHLLEKLPN